MKKTALMLSACAFAPALFVATAASADCRQDLRNVSNINDRAAQEAGFSTKQVRRIREVARIMARSGNEDACQEIVAVLEDISTDQQASQGRSSRDRDREARRDGSSDRGDQQRSQRDRSDRADASDRQRNRDRDRDMAYNDDRNNDAGERSNRKNPERLQKADNAQPVLDQDGNFSVGEIMGATVYSAKTGESVGEVEDLIMGGDEREIVLGHGGFLGMGEKRIKIAMDDLLVNRNDNSYYIDMTDRQLKRAPGVEKENGRWVEASTGADNSDESSVGKQMAKAKESAENWLTGDDQDRDREQQRSNNRDKSEQQAARDQRDSDQKRNRDQARNTDDRERASQSERQMAQNEMISDDANKADKKAAKNAKSIDNAKNSMSINELVGETVYSSVSNDSIGEIEDVIVKLGGSDHSFVLAHGGFLGLGEKRIKLNISDLRYDANDERYYVDLTNQELKNKPGLTKVDGTWTSKSVDTESN